MDLEYTIEKCYALHERWLIIGKGAELASATVPWHWLFFCLASKLCYENYDILNYLSKKLRGLEVALVDFSPDRRPW